MSKITVVIGEPATGKSTLMKHIMRKRGSWVFEASTKYVPYHLSDKLCIIGRYDDMDHQFPGTDRMSMACQQYVLNFISDNSDFNYLIEGDRLSNKTFLWELRDRGHDLVVLLLRPSSDVLQDRRESEREQSDRFIKSRQTKIANLVKFCVDAGIPLIETDHSVPVHTALITSDILKDRI